MLIIPETVKALYKRDGVNKNFRAHFPNGELPDITNENIVQESVKFQESVCSQDVFKFGLTEASVIEFETVGVPNMYGMTVACYNEIDCSSLTAAEIADIEAGTWDGTFDSTNKVFSVPYGVFRVESCPRDHQAMAHRKVTAYTLAGGEIECRFEEEKLSLLLPGATYKPNLYLLGLSAIYQNIEGGLENEGFTKTEYTPTVTSDVQHILDLKNSGGQTVSLIFSAYGKTESNLTQTQSNYLIACEVNTSAIKNAIDTAISVLQDFDIDYTASGYRSYLDILKDGWRTDISGVNSIYPRLFYAPYRRKGSSVYEYPLTAGLNFDKSTQAFYAYRNLDGGTIGAAFGFTTKLSILQVDSSVQHICLSEQNGTFYKYTEPASISDVTLNFEPTHSEKVGTGATSFIGSAFDGAYSITDIVKGLLELKAQFAAPDRSGGYRVIRLSSASPVAIAPDEYSQMWFDEFSVDPIGIIRYQYKNEAEEDQVVDYQIGDGASVYDMTDNAVVRILGLQPADIEAMLDTGFVPYLGPVNFVPIDLEMKGLPYIEAGDALSVTAQDGVVCNSYALRRELDGVQVLTDQIDSESGLIIDSEGA